jgi:hypothetical protein
VPKFDEAMRTYIFTTGNIVEIEKATEAGEKNPTPATDDRPKTRATIGDMKGN